MSAISLLLPNLDGAVTQTEGPRDSGIRETGFDTSAAPGAFESILQQARETGRAERDRSENRADEQRSESVAPPASAEPEERTTAPATDSPSDVNHEPDAQQTDQATPAPSADSQPNDGNLKTATEQGAQTGMPLRSVLQASHTMSASPSGHAAPGHSTGLPGAAANQAMVAALGEQTAKPIRAVLQANTANQGPEPSALLTRGGELGLRIQQTLETAEQSVRNPSQAVPEGPSQLAPIAEGMATALTEHGGKLVRAPGTAETASILNALLNDRLAQADLGELAHSFQTNKRLHQTPMGHRNVANLLSATGHEAGEAAASVAGGGAFAGVGDSSAVRPIAEQLATRVVSWAEMTKSEGRTVFHLRLDPPSLGSVRVELSATAQVVSVKLIASNQAAGHILQTQLHELRQSLTAADVSFANLDVSYNESGSQGPAWQQELHPYSLSHGETGGVPDEQPAGWQWRSRSDALIDVLG